MLSLGTDILRNGGKQSVDDHSIMRDTTVCAGIKEVIISANRYHFATHIGFFSCEAYNSCSQTCNMGLAKFFVNFLNASIMVGANEDPEQEDFLATVKTNG